MMAIHHDVLIPPVRQLLDVLQEFGQGHQPGVGKGAERVFLSFPNVE
jgi:hypothetical protein